MWQLRPFLEQGYFASITHAFVTSKLDYSNVFYVELTLEMTWKVGLVQNAVAQLVRRARRYEHLTTILQKLHWLPVSFHSPFRVLVLSFKALHDLGAG